MEAGVTRPRSRVWPATWRWFFAVAFFGAALPVSVVVVSVELKELSFEWSQVGGRGEFFLMAVGVNGSTHGVTRYSSDDVRRLSSWLEILSWLSLATLALAAVAWGLIVGSSIANESYDVDLATALGGITLLVSIIVCLVLVGIEAFLRAEAEFTAQTEQVPVVNLGRLLSKMSTDDPGPETPESQ